LSGGGPSRRAGLPGPLDPYWYSDVGTRSGSGVLVTPETALRLIDVYACVRVIAETMGSIPNLLYRNLGQDEEGNPRKELATDQGLYQVLKSRPNNWQTSIEFVEMMTGHVCLRGNAYGEKVWGSRGAVDQVIPLHPARMQVQQLDNGQLRYVYRRPDGKEVTYRQDEIFHLRGFTSDGMIGMNPVQVAREGIGLAIATERFGARVMHNNAVPNGVVSHPATLSDKAYARLRASIRDQTGGVEKAGSFLILEEGMKWQQIGMKPEDLQFLETRQMNLRQIARLFRVPLHMLGDLEAGASYASVEQMGQEFITYTLLPWMVRWEQAIARDLIADPETYFCEFDVDRLARGDMASRYAAYSVARQSEWLSVNEIRGKENLNPIEGGDEHSNPNVASGQGPVPGKDGPPAPPAAPPVPGKPGKKKPKPDKKKKKDDEEKPDGEASARGESEPPAWMQILANDAADRIATAELRETEKHASKAAADLSRWSAWSRDFFVGHLFYVTKTVLPLCEAAGMEDPRQTAEAIAGAICDRRAKLLADAADPAALISSTWSDRGQECGELILVHLVARKN